MPYRSIAIFLFLAAVLPVAAHDFWLEPSSFRPARGAPVAIRLMAGDHGKGEPVRRNDRRIESFVVRDGDGERAVGGTAGGDPAGYIDSISANAMVGYRSRPVRHGDMSPARFESYLREEGLERVIESRSASGDAQKPGREIFSRSAKAWIARGAGGRFDGIFGFRFEIVLDSDPHADIPLSARVLFEGRPVHGVLVSAIHRASGRKVSDRSDTEGRVALPVRGGGLWLVKAVHMVPAAVAGADWESIWATLSFEKVR